MFREFGSIDFGIGSFASSASVQRLLFTQNERSLKEDSERLLCRPNILGYLAVARSLKFHREIIDPEDPFMLFGVPISVDYAGD